MYQRCSHCGCVTDNDETKCPLCGMNSFQEAIMPVEQLIFGIKDGCIPPDKVRTKRPDAILQVFGAPS